MTASRWIMLIVFAISILGAICVCPYVIHNSESRKTRDIAEHFQCLFSGITTGILMAILYNTLSK